jgi:membrane protein
VSADLVENRPLVGPGAERDRTVEDQPRGGSRAKRFMKLLARDVVADDIDDVGAMMTFFAILALFPMVLFVITLSMLVVDAGTVRQGLDMAAQALSPSATEVISGQVYSLLEGANPGLAVGTLVFALWGASRGTAALSRALNRLYDKVETRPWWKRQLIAIAVTVGIAVIMVIALALLVIGPAAGGWLAGQFGLGGAFEVAWNIGRWIGAGLLVMVVWAILYKFLPDTDAPFRVFTPGAIVGVLLWLAISRGFAFYLQSFGNYEATYGALGGVIIFLTWLWLSNIAILFGAELNDVLARFRKHESAAAAQLDDPHEKTQAPSP